MDKKMAIYPITTNQGQIIVVDAEEAPRPSRCKEITKMVLKVLAVAAIAYLIGTQPLSLVKPTPKPLPSACEVWNTRVDGIEASLADQSAVLRSLPAGADIDHEETLRKTLVKVYNYEASRAERALFPGAYYGGCHSGQASQCITLHTLELKWRLQDHFRHYRPPKCERTPNSEALRAFPDK